METEPVSKTLVDFNYLMRVSAQNNYTEFCHCKNYKTQSTVLLKQISLSIFRFVPSQGFQPVLLAEHADSPVGLPSYEQCKYTETPDRTNTVRQHRHFFSLKRLSCSSPLTMMHTDRCILQLLRT